MNNGEDSSFFPEQCLENGEAGVYLPVMVGLTYIQVIKKVHGSKVSYTYSTLP